VLGNDDLDPTVALVWGRPFDELIESSTPVTGPAPRRAALLEPELLRVCAVVLQQGLAVLTLVGVLGNGFDDD